MKAILSADLNWGIGYKGNLLQRIPEDMKYFKQMTIGKVVVMGRETFESFPGKEPLKDRINIVLSRSESFKNDKVTVCRSLDQLFHELEKYDTDDIFVIGGESVYKQLLPYCTEVYVTRFQKAFVADRYFTDLDREGTWKLVSAGEVRQCNDIKFSFLKYARA